MNNTENTSKKTPLREVAYDNVQKKPDEAAGLDIEAKFRIYEPISGKTLVEGRG